MFQWVYPMQSALVPHCAAATLVLCDPFLLSTPLAVYGPEARFDLELFVLGFLHGFTPRARDHSGAVCGCPKVIAFDVMLFSAFDVELSLPSYRCTNRNPCDTYSDLAPLSLFASFPVFTELLIRFCVVRHFLFEDGVGDIFFFFFA